MNEVQLLYVENVIYKKKTALIQELTFFIKLHNLSPNKVCEVVWAGEDEQWHTLYRRIFIVQSMKNKNIGRRV